MIHLSKGPGEHKTPSPEGGEANEGVADDTDGEEEGEQQAHDPVGRAQDELPHGQPLVAPEQRRPSEPSFSLVFLLEIEPSFSKLLSPSNGPPFPCRFGLRLGFAWKGFYTNTSRWVDIQWLIDFQLIFLW